MGGCAWGAWGALAAPARLHAAPVMRATTRRPAACCWGSLGLQCVLMGPCVCASAVQLPPCHPTVLPADCTEVWEALKAAKVVVLPGRAMHCRCAAPAAIIAAAAAAAAADDDDDAAAEAVWHEGCREPSCGLQLLNPRGLSSAPAAAVFHYETQQPHLRPMRRMFADPTLRLPQAHPPPVSAHD